MRSSLRVCGPFLHKNSPFLTTPKIPPFLTTTLEIKFILLALSLPPPIIPLNFLFSSFILKRLWKETPVYFLRIDLDLLDVIVLDLNPKLNSIHRIFYNMYSNQNYPLSLTFFADVSNYINGRSWPDG